MTMRSITRSLLILAIAAFCTQVQAQQSERFDNYELFYSVVNTTFLEPDTAAAYNITRGKRHAIINLAVREHVGDRSEPRKMLLRGRTSDLMRSETLEFREIREGEAIYYIAQFKFINEEWRVFEIDFRPEGADRTYNYKFRHQLYIH